MLALEGEKNDHHIPPLSCISFTHLSFLWALSTVVSAFRNSVALVLGQLVRFAHEGVLKVVRIPCRSSFSDFGILYRTCATRGQSGGCFTDVCNCLWYSYGSFPEHSRRSMG